MEQQWVLAPWSEGSRRNFYLSLFTFNEHTDRASNNGSRWVSEGNAVKECLESGTWRGRANLLTQRTLWVRHLAWQSKPTHSKQFVLSCLHVNHTACVCYYSVRCLRFLYNWASIVFLGHHNYLARSTVGVWVLKEVIVSLKWIPFALGPQLLNCDSAALVVNLMRY